MTTKERIILESKAWRQEKLSIDPEYFTRLEDRHHPKILWICSSDSLASIREMTNTEPGDILVYRNVGALVRQDDASLMAVVEAAIEIHHVTHIIVCGYSQCSAIQRVVNSNDSMPALDRWLQPLRQVYDRYLPELQNLPPLEQEKRLSELNIKQQVINLGNIPAIRRAWQKHDYPRIFGWYFDLGAGTLREVFSLEENHRGQEASANRQNGSALDRMAS
jgi:carbonic anhydrase